MLGSTNGNPAITRRRLLLGILRAMPRPAAVEQDVRQCNNNKHNYQGWRCIVLGCQTDLRQRERVLNYQLLRGVRDGAGSTVRLGGECVRTVKNILGIEVIRIRRSGNRCQQFGVEIILGLDDRTIRAAGLNRHRLGDSHLAVVRYGYRRSATGRRQVRRAFRLESPCRRRRRGRRMNDGLWSRRNWLWLRGGHCCGVERQAGTRRGGNFISVIARFQHGRAALNWMLPVPAAATLKVIRAISRSPLRLVLVVPRAIEIEPPPPELGAAISNAVVLKLVDSYVSLFWLSGKVCPVRQ